MNATNLILYADKKKTKKDSDKFFKLPKLELNADALQSFRSEAIIIVLNDTSSKASMKSFVEFLMHHQEELSHSSRKASFITNIVGSKALGEMFQEVFNKVAVIQDKYLHTDELVDVLRAENRDELVIGASIDKSLQVITFTKGDLTKLAIPFSFFQNVSSNIKFDSLELIDYGQTVKFGKIEISFDSILYEYSEEYRKKLIKKRRSENQSFGACLRRYRMLKKMKQTDFKTIGEREIRRIENEQVDPHMSTKNEILSELGISEKELLTY